MAESIPRSETELISVIQHSVENHRDAIFAEAPFSLQLPKPVQWFQRSTGGRLVKVCYAVNQIADFVLKSLLQYQM
jgi:hypothetical protein